MDVTACYPKVKYRSKSSGSVSNAGMLLLTETARPTAVHLPGGALPEVGDHLIVDLDASLVSSHS
ncbi:MAG: hypothetical protein HQ453_02130 [Actinobacteria bacterium]|nr:hypothetical protein [Actinomycetota bacterium]